MSKSRYEFRILESENAGNIVKWNEGRDAAFLEQWAGRGFTFPITEEKVLTDKEKCSAVFEIMLQGNMIGTIALLRVDAETGSGYMGHFLLAPEMRGKGHGTAALREFAIYCFGILKLKELTLRVFSYNKGAVCCYEANGFRVIETSQTENGLEVLLMCLKKTKIENSVQAQIEICREMEADWLAAERMTQHAFWNLHSPGCDEHLLVENMRGCEDYIPELSRIAKLGDEVAGGIWYSKAFVLSDDGTKQEVLTFGPLCVEPRYQSLGIGGKLLRTTMEDARRAGYQAIIIFGEPGYYPRFGFQTCDHFGITTPDGKNFDAFMGIELQPGALASVKGKFYEAEVFMNLPKEEVEVCDAKFPALIKCRLPGQWT